MRLVLFVLPVLTAFAVSTAAVAGSLQVTPVSFELSPSAPSATLTVRNEGEASTWLQVRAFEWIQRYGEDVLTGTTRLIVSPPVGQVAPGAEQLFRIVATGHLPGAGQQVSYRLLVDELPDEPVGEGRAVRVLLRYSLPLTITAPDAAPARLTATLAADGGDAALQIENGGGRRAGLSDVRLVSGDDTVVVMEGGGLLGYVLPGSTRRWPIDLPDEPRTDLQLRFLLDGQPHQLPVGRR